MYLIWWLALTVLFTACNGKGGDREGRGMYYWSTTFNLDSAKLQFLDDHDVHRLYVRYFDVVIDEKGEIMPNASIRFPRSTHSSPNNQQPLSITIIPTIFIVNDVMRHDVSGLAEKILQRILQMNKTHGIENYRLTATGRCRHASDSSHLWKNCTSWPKTKDCSSQPPSAYINSPKNHHRATTVC